MPRKVSPFKQEDILWQCCPPDELGICHQFVRHEGHVVVRARYPDGRGYPMGQYIPPCYEAMLEELLAAQAEIRRLKAQVKKRKWTPRRASVKGT